MPERIAFLLQTVRTLLGYGRHLADTVTRRAAAPTFPSIAVGFGTANLSVILAHLQRGILRAMALERVLLARAAAGRDIEFEAPREAASPGPAAPAEPAAEQPAETPAAPPAEPPAERKAARRPHRPSHPDDPTLYMPSLKELEAQARRRPLGRSIVDICLDLAALPAFCHGRFWNELFHIIRGYGGSLDTLMRESRRREEAFDQEQDRTPGRTWEWINQSRERIREALGFFIGEPPVDPFDASPAPGVPVAAMATGPP